LRAVGDALAWRVMGFDRRRIVALSRNEPSGPIVNKAGLPFELGVVDECWRKRGHFALLHDLTSCLRIGDVTEFAADGHRLLEVKASRGRSRPEQSARMSAAVATINTGAPLPNGEELVDVDVALRTHLDTFSDALELSLARGVAACRVPGGRAVVAYSVLDVIRLGEGADDWIARSNRTRSAVLRRAHMDGATHHFSIRTTDRAARSPVSVPYGVYPLDPSLCAGLICDLLVAEIIFDPAALVDAAGRVGVRAEVLLPSRHGQVPPDGDVVRFHWGDRAMISHAQFIDQVLSEFMDLDAVAAGIRALLARPVAPDSAILVFAGQPQIWR
jgi:hypothetical protein